MNQGSSIFLRAIVILIGIGALTILLWEPHIEGRNAHATVFEIYFKDPFLAYAYIGSSPFFVALYQAFKVLGYAGRDEVFSHAAVKAMRTIKYCAMALIGFIAVGTIFILFSESDDRAGGLVIGLVFVLGSTVMAAAATLFERLLQKAVDLKSENDVLRERRS